MTTIGLGHLMGTDQKSPMRTSPSSAPAPTLPTIDCKPAANKPMTISTATMPDAQQGTQPLFLLNLRSSDKSHDSTKGFLETQWPTQVQDAKKVPADDRSSWDTPLLVPPQQGLQANNMSQTFSPMRAAVHCLSHLNKSQATSAPTAGGWAIQTWFSWKKGFLTNHKPPTCRTTPASMPHQHRPSARTQSNNTPPTLFNNGGKCVVSNNLWTIITQEGLGDPATVLPLAVTNISLPGEWPKLRFSQCYDIHMCLYSKHGKVYSKWEALTKFLLQLQAHDHTIQLLPWKATEHNGDNPAIEISSIPNAFFDRHTYVPRLASLTASWTTRANLGRTQHPYLFLSSSDPQPTWSKKWDLGCKKQSKECGLANFHWQRK